jgi:hypothetical protein
MDGQETIWRASLQDIRTGERRGFADLEAACRYLHAQVELASGRSPISEPPQDKASRGGSQSG